MLLRVAVVQFLLIHALLQNIGNPKPQKQDDFRINRKVISYPDYGPASAEPGIPIGEVKGGERPGRRLVFEPGRALTTNLFGWMPSDSFPPNMESCG